MKNLVDPKSVGIMLILASFGMELFGLFTQYFLGFEPCANCVQIRLLIIFIAMAGVLHYFSGESFTTKIMTLSLSIVSIYYSLKISWENHLIETGQVLSNCSQSSPFPSFIPLDSWLPVLFEPKGPCGTPAPLWGDISFTDLSIVGLALLLGLVILILVLNLSYLNGKITNESK